MRLQPFFVVAAALGLLVIAWRSAGWGGIALVGGGIVLWLLLHWTRAMHVLKRAADRPVGHVDSAVMLNARLKPGLPLLHVMALTRAIGALESRAGEQPEVYRWTDGSQASVRCEFGDGRLVRWELSRPPGSPEGGDDTMKA